MEGLPTHSFTTDSGDVTLKCPTEAPITDRREKELAALRKDLDAAAKWAKEHKRPVFLGEFGAYQKADMDSRARWTRAVVSEAEARGFSWAYWEFCATYNY